MHQATRDVLSQILQAGLDHGIIRADFLGHPLTFTTLRENETTLFENGPITSGLDQINANSHFSFVYGVRLIPILSEPPFCDEKVFPFRDP